MSEHRRKPPQSHSGGRAAARRGSQPPSPGRRAAPPQGSPAPGGHRSGSYPGASHASGAGGGRPYGGRAEARRAAQAAARGGRRRAAAGGAGRGGAGGGRRGYGGSGGGYGGGDGPKRLIDYPRHDRWGWRRWVPSWKLVTGLCLAFFGSLVVLAGVGYAMVVVPDVNEASQQQSNVFFWDDGSVMVHKGETNRQNVDISEISPAMQDAVISAENATFRQDKGVDPKGIARALFNMATGGDVQGGSTITQQYVKNTMLSQDQTVTRKLKELFISIKVGRSVAKDDILAGYLNTAWYGRQAYGIQAAAQAYYGKDAKNLDPNESAFLAALLKNANLFNPDGGVGPGATPQENRQRVEGRWNDILDLMVKNGHLSQAARITYKFPVPDKPKAEAGLTGQIGYLTDTAEKYVMKKTDIEKRELERGGYQIHTTFNKKKVQELEAAVKKTRKQYVKENKRPKDKFVQFGAASIQPGTGKMVAIYGGAGYDRNHFANNADTQGVPVGSTWKPFVLAAAMEHGTLKSAGKPISADSKYNGDPNLVIKNADGTPWLNEKNETERQRNEGPTKWGFITLKKAMEQSINTPFVQLGMDVGLKKVREVALEAGLPEETMADLQPSFSIGTSTPSAIRMADAYATFAKSGTQVDPYSVTEVEHKGEQVPGLDKPRTSNTIDEDVANNITKVLQNVIQNGTAKTAKELNRPAAGKTGTTDQNKSAWFVGYTPQLSTSVTMFREDDAHPKLLSMNGVGGFDSIHGGALPTEVWTEYMKAALQGQPIENFPEAVPIGGKVDQSGAPTPTPSTVTPSTEPTPTITPSESPTPSTLPTPTGKPNPTCSGLLCDGRNSGGGNGGNGGNGGPTRDPSPSSSDGDGGLTFGSNG